MRLLVAGGTGVIGRSIARHALASGCAVVTTSRNPVGDGVLPPGVEHAVCDRQDYGAFAALVHRIQPDAVIDLACFSALDAWSAVEACGDKPRYVCCSSVAVQKVRPGRVDERTPADSTRPYGRGKIVAERVLRDAAAAGRLRSVVARPSIVFGPGGQLPRQTGDLRPWVHRVRRGKPILVIDDGAARCQLLFADDAARALFGLATVFCDEFGVFTVAPRESCTWRDYHTLVARCIGREPSFASASMAELLALDPVQFDESDELSGHDVVFDTSALEAALPGWQPCVGMADAIMRTMEALNEEEVTVDLEGQLIAILARRRAIDA